MITSPHLGTTLLYDVSRWWSLYLNRCVTESSLEDVGQSVATVPFLLDPILLDMEGGWYAVRLLPDPLVDLVSGRCGGGGGNGSGGGGGTIGGGKRYRCGGGGRGGRGGRGGSGDRGRGGGAGQGGASGRGGLARSTARMWVHYDAHLPSMSLRYRENLCTILAGTVIPTVQGHILSKTWTTASVTTHTLLPP